MFLIKTVQTSSDQGHSGRFYMLMIGLFISPLHPVGTIAMFSTISMQSITIVEEPLQVLRQIFNFLMSLCYHFLKYNFILLVCL